MDDTDGSRVSTEDPDKAAEDLVSGATMDDMKEADKRSPDLFGAGGKPALEIRTSFRVGRNYWFRNKTLEEKEVGFCFDPTDEEADLWKRSGLPNVSSLLTYLKRKYGSLDGFDVAFFRGTHHNPFYFVGAGRQTVYVNLDEYITYYETIMPAIKDLRMVKYAHRIKKEYAQKIPVAFFGHKPPESLVQELRQSNYTMIEDVIRGYEGMADAEKRSLQAVFANSRLARDAMAALRRMGAGSPSALLARLMGSMEGLSPKELEILVGEILKPKISRRTSAAVGRLPEDRQKILAGRLPEVAFVQAKFDKMRRSLDKFQRLIDRHRGSARKDEREIHAFLAGHPWLLGPEYYGGDIRSDIDARGNLTGETRIGPNQRADFIMLRKMGGLDVAVAVEIEEANDRIFNRNGTISRCVYDGITQALGYRLEQKISGAFSRCMAVIGSIEPGSLNEGQQRRLDALIELFPTVEIMTYEDIIARARAALDFWGGRGRAAGRRGGRRRK